MLVQFSGQPSSVWQGRRPGSIALPQWVKCPAHSQATLCCQPDPYICWAIPHSGQPHSAATYIHWQGKNFCLYFFDEVLNVIHFMQSHEIIKAVFKYRCKKKKSKLVHSLCIMNLLHLAGASRNATFFTAHQNKLVAIPPGYCSLIPMVSLISYIHLHICRLCSSQEPHPLSRFFPNHCDA